MLESFIWLIENYEPGQIIDFNYDIVDLDLEVGGDKDRYRARINENLKKLDKKYDLVEAKIVYGKNAEVLIKQWVEEKEPLFEIPNTFYKYGWNERLSLPGKFCLFINFLYSGLSHETWFKSKKLLSKEFNVSHSTVTKGMLELKERNLIDIERGSIESGFADRPANRYRLKNLYSIDNFNSELEKLKMKYGVDKVEKARELAKIILDEYNLEHMEDIVLLVNEYGTDSVGYAFNKISKYRIDNPMRNLRYVVGILKSEEN